MLTARCFCEDSKSSGFVCRLLECLREWPARLLPATLAAFIAAIQYSCWEIGALSSEVSSKSRRNLHSSGISSGLHVESRTISARTVAWWVSLRCPFTLLWSKKFRKSHCLWEIVRSLVTRVFIHEVPDSRLLTVEQKAVWYRSRARGSRP